MILTARQYRDRVEAGKVLARQLAPYASRVDTLVLGLARGGVAIGAEVAAYLRAPLDAFIVQRIESPEDPQMTLGVIASGGASVFDRDAICQSGLSGSSVHEITERETKALKR